MLLLYTADTGNGRRATIMLEECGLAYELRKVEVGSKKTVKPADLLAINPEGTIPTLVDPDGPEGRPIHLRQSTAILFYLADKTGRLKTSAVHRPAMLEWTMFAVTDIVGANTAMYQTMLEFPDAVAVAEHFKKQLISFLRIADQRLSEAQYLSGDEFSIADIALFPVIVSRRALVEAATGLDHVKRWGKSVAARPAVKRALAHFA